MLHLDPSVSIPQGVCCVVFFVAITTLAEQFLLTKFLWNIVLEWIFVDLFSHYIYSLQKHNGIECI